MEVRPWKDTANDTIGRTYGLYVGTSNRDELFDPAWEFVNIEIDGESFPFRLPSGFWNQCPEIRDSGSTRLRDWLAAHDALTWELRQPPRFHLIPVGEKSERRFLLEV